MGKHKGNEHPDEAELTAKAKAFDDLWNQSRTSAPKSNTPNLDAYEANQKGKHRK